VETSLLEWWRLISEKRSDSCAHSQEDDYNEALKAFLPAIIAKLDPEKPSFRPSKWPRKLKLKTAKNSKLPKLSKNCFEPVGKGGWPPISTWINLPLALGQYKLRNNKVVVRDLMYGTMSEA
jgi:hypothetical protein